MEKELTSLPNIGKVLAEKLKETGIATADELRATGSEKAFIRLLTVDEGACIVKLMALEGAIQGVPLHNLDEASKAELKDVYQQIKAIKKQ